MSTYLKIHSAVELDEDLFGELAGRFFLDYDRQEDDPDEHFRYEYFFTPYEDEDGEEEWAILDEKHPRVLEFQKSAKDVIEILNKAVGKKNYSTENQTGAYIEGC